MKIYIELLVKYKVEINKEVSQVKCELTFHGQFLPKA